MFAQTVLMFASEASTLSLGFVGFGCLAAFTLMRRSPAPIEAAATVNMVERAEGETLEPAIREHNLAA